MTYRREFRLYLSVVRERQGCACPRSGEQPRWRNRQTFEDIFRVASKSLVKNFPETNDLEIGSLFIRAFSHLSPFLMTHL